MTTSALTETALASIKRACTQGISKTCRRLVSSGRELFVPAGGMVQRGPESTPAEDSVGSIHDPISASFDRRTGRFSEAAGFTI